MGWHAPRRSGGSRRTGELPVGLDVDRLTLAMLSGVQGGLLLSQVRRDTRPLEAAVDTMVQHLRSMGRPLENPANAVLGLTLQFLRSSLREY
jgi:hypothetical protein